MEKQEVKLFPLVKDMMETKDYAKILLELTQEFETFAAYKAETPRLRHNLQHQSIQDSSKKYITLEYI